MSARIDAGQPLTDEARRILDAEINGAIAALAEARGNPARAIHATRKRFKKIRALLKLLRAADEEFYQRENARYRDLSRSFAPPREATALMETVERFQSEYPREAEGLSGLRERLAQRCPIPGDQRLGWIIDKAIATCEAGAAAAARFEAPASADAASAVLEKGVRKTLRKANRTLKAAEAGGGEDDFHELRKCIKAYGAHLSLLADIWPQGAAKRRAAAEKLGTALGDLNDLAVMAGLIETAEEPLGSEQEVATLRKLVRRKRKTLAKRTLADARDLLDGRPKQVAARLAKAYREAAELPEEAPERAVAD